MNQYNGVEIAIIGMSGQFPGAGNVNEFWNNLRDGKESIAFFTEQELLDEGVAQDTLSNPAYVRANAYLSNKEYFDAAFFGYLPDEAKLMDPQIRLFHENCWKALEDAGYNVENNKEKIGLFAGGSPNTNWVSHSYLANQDTSINNFAAFHLRDVTFLCSRVSYLLNLQGPSIYLNTACSTSLVAVQRACMSLLLRECKMALAGGITITNFSSRGYYWEEGMIFSRDGHCRAFDADATGTISGEGVGVVVLKRLQDAIADGDNIHAVIRGSGINNDGGDKMAYTAPGIEGQSQAILKAISMAKIPANSISYVEAHGTGTKLGDPVEVEALNHAFGKSEIKYCALGAVKSNIGHLDAAAGIAGLIKTVLALKHRQIPPSLHYTQANPAINFKDSPFYVNNELKEWKNDKYPLRAGVSSFGIGGTNAHVVLEEAPAKKESPAGREQQLLVLSAKTNEALQRNTGDLVNYLKENSTENIADVAYTLQTGRAAFAYRKMVVCGSAEEAVGLLSTGTSVKQSVVNSKVDPQLVFMFSGQGSQYQKMCYELYEQEPVFKNEADKCFEIVKAISGRDMKAVVFGDDDSISVDDTMYTQPLLFIMEYALAQLVMHWGIKPAIMIGHSIGEYVAACISGVFSLEDALRLVVKRGELMQSAERGKMLSISISEAALLPLLEGHAGVSLAAVNSSELCVASGIEEAMTRFKDAMESKGYSCKWVRTSHAFHSAMMDGILDDFRKEVQQATINASQIPFISNITGKAAEAAMVMQPGYWVDHLRGTVRFADGIETLLENSNAMFVEVGPGRVLCSMVRSNNKRQKHHAVISLVKQHSEQTPDQRHLLQGIGELWVHGIIADWNKFYNGEKRNKLSLPTYSFERTKYPVLADAFKLISQMIAEKPAVNEHDIASWFYVPAWKKLPLISTANTNNKPCLLFMDNSGIGEAISHQVENCICVKAATAFKKISGSLYELNPSNEDDYKKLFSENIVFEKIIHAWPVSKDSASMDVYFYSLLHMVKALGGNITGKAIVLLTNDLYTITGDENICTGTSMTTGLLKVISQEYPSVAVSHIDISLSGETNIDKLVNEIRKSQSGKTIALRRSQRWVQVFDQLDREETTTTDIFKNEGVYFITGGLGNLGYHLSKQLRSKFNAKLALAGRTKLPPGEEWNNSTDKKVQKLLELGIDSVLYFDIDVSDSAALSTAIKNAETKFGPINGVIHAAGVVSGSSINSISQLSKEDFEYQFSSKIKGVQSLKEALQGKALDFCLVTSSLSSVLGGLGFAAYASANTFMDQYITAHKEKGELNNWVSVNLDGLDFEHSTVNSANIKPYQVWNVIERALSLKDLPQVVVSKSDLQKRLNDWISRKPSATIVEEETIIASANGSTEETLLLLWKDFFGKQNITPEDDFFDIGGDSLKALTMIGRIYKTLHVEISVSEFFKHPSVKGLSEYIDALKPEEKQASGFVSIPKAPVKDHYQLSSAQRRLYFLHKLDKNSIAYNIPQVVRLTGELNKEKLTAVFGKLVERHESLRTSFALVNDEPVQNIIEHITLNIEYFRCGTTEVDAVIKQFVRPFDLEQAPLIRLGLIETNPQEHFLLVDMHHIITDGVTQRVLIQDFMALYANESLPELQLQYKDYAEWQQSSVQQERIAKQKEFWLNEFAETPTVLDLPTDLPRPLVRSYEGGLESFVLSAEATKKLRSVAAANDATMFMVVLAAYNILVSKLGGQEDVVIGTAVAGRPHADLENIVGMFVNTLPLRNYPKGELSFRDFLSSVRSATLAGFDNQDYQYEELIDVLQVERDTSRNPLFDVVFAYQNFEQSSLAVPGLLLTPYNNNHTVSKFDLILLATESGDELHFDVEYSAALFKKETIERFIEYFRNIVNAITLDVDKKIADIEVIGEQERTDLLKVLNNTGVAYPTGKTIVDIFEEQAAKYADNIAVEFEGQQLTYRALNERSNQLVNLLRNEGVIRGSIVGLLADRTLDTVTGMLAILKAGGAYLPIDVDYPEERISYMIEDSGLQFLLTSGKQTRHNVKTIYFGDDRIANLQPSNLQHSNSPSDVCYIIYTSGTTGNPKGVMVEHKNVVRLLFNDQFQFDFKENDVWTMFHSHCFDFSVWEIYGALLYGGKVIIIPKMISKDPSRYLQVLKEKEVTVVNQTPSAFYNLIQADQENDEANLKVRYVIFGGEALKPAKLKPWFNKYPATRLVNMFGITETTVHVTYKEIGEYEIEHNISNIGKPIPTLSAYIFDKHQKLVPQGVIGELFVGGEGVARGYLNRESLTSQRFIINPYNQNERLYRSGDHARLMSSGDLEYLGRMDNQVKIRGFRIELGEVEAQISKHLDVEDVIVIAKKDTEGNTFLCAYLVTQEDLSVAAIRSQLLAVLPDYLVPSYFVLLDSIPLTSNGKVNKKLLPEPEVNAGDEYIAPSSDTEERLTTIWSDVLKLDRSVISVRKSFFELGGHSLKASVLTNKILKEFNIEVPLQDVFSIDTIEKLSDYIENEKWVRENAQKEMSLGEEFILD